MSKKDAKSLTFVAISPSHADELATLCRNARSGMQDVVDLIIVHNEKRVGGGRNRRVVLNRMIAFQAVAVWERLVRDVKAIVSVDNRSDGNGLAYLRERGGSKQSSRTVQMLRTASSGVLPEAWQIWLPRSGAGKQPTFGRAPLSGSSDDVAETVDWWVGVRNGVAHRNVGIVPTWLIRTDADAQNGETVNTTTARFAFALFLQFVDQTIRVLLEEAKVGSRTRDRLVLPAEWLNGREIASRLHAGEDENVLTLWSGRSLAVVER